MNIRWSVEIVDLIINTFLSPQKAAANNSAAEQEKKEVSSEKNHNEKKHDEKNHDEHTRFGLNVVYA